MSPRKRLARMIRRWEEMIATAEWWNTNRTDAEPLDCEPERIALKMAREIERLRARGDMKAAQEKSGELVRYAMKAMR